jgi:hypothetical protein
VRLVRFDLTTQIRLTDDNIRRGMTPLSSNWSRIARLTLRAFSNAWRIALRAKQCTGDDQ